MAHNNCEGEAHDHSHGDGHNHEHDHSADITPAIQYVLYYPIDFASVRTLNEARPGSGKEILRKTWAQRFDSQPELESDADEQLIIHVPFTGQVRLHSIHIRTSNSDSAPLTLHVHQNNEDLDFNTASSTQPAQSFSLGQTSEIQDILVKRTLFNTVRHLTLFFEDNHGRGDEDVTRISYIAFKGDFIKLNKEPVEVLYEAAARPADHKVKGEVGMGMGSGVGGGGPQQGF